MLLPAKTKYRKHFRRRGSFTGTASRGARLAYGPFGLKAIDCGELSSRQLEAARRAMTRYLKRGGKVWIRIFPDKPITRKAAEVPMGAGKGALEKYVAVVKPGRIIFEMDGIPLKDAKQALKLAAYKLPIQCTVVTK